MLGPFGNSGSRGVSRHHGAVVTIAFLGWVFFPDHSERNLRPRSPLCQLVGNPSCILKERKKGAVYKARSIMPRAGARAGATGDAGGAAGSKERSTEAQTNTRGCPRE